MITYVDTSTIVKRLVEEDGSDRADAIWSASEVLVACPLVVVEARSALAAAHRAKRLTAAQLRTAKGQLDLLLEEITFIAIDAALVSTAADLAEAEALRGYDAVHLAAALVAGSDVMASADTDLCAAAGRRALVVANPLG